ncbi:MAG: hypothetical protein C4520_00165 [Candidatus Abyssobacteria bacterium SURF_5]|uniref:Uncharacterized protein n=1 Tax=Abyssobacteria bacterium (strain SURF_5) TaxID=2093360 RepID=A0A3A4PFY8_ABYX5|nr:MAG: hypothetical protein C4520_00165 [Candidatus Abyssubacteria bacterium SURF_5]
MLFIQFHRAVKYSIATGSLESADHTYLPIPTWAKTNFPNANCPIAVSPVASCPTPKYPPNATCPMARKPAVSCPIPRSNPTPN